MALVKAARRPETWLLAIIGLALLMQLTRLGTWAIEMTKNKVWPDRHLDAISRSADVAYGGWYMDFMRFARAQTPSSATIVIPLESDLPQFASIPFLQYFLLPRRVVDCPQASMEACLRALAGPATYFMYLGSINLPSDLEATLQVQAFDETSGLITPR